MKKYLKILSLVMMLCLTLNTHYSTFASDDIKNSQDNIVIGEKKKSTNNEKQKNESTNEEKTIDTSIRSDAFKTGMDPEEIDSDGEKIATPIIKIVRVIINRVLGIIQWIGAIVMVISIAIFGFGLLANGNPGLAKDLGFNLSPKSNVGLLQLGRNLAIGSSLLFASSSIVKFVFQAVY